MTKKLTEEQKEKRRQFREISKRYDKEHGKDRVKRTGQGEDAYRSYVIFDDTNISEGGWYYGRKWMTAKFMRQAVDRWVAMSFETGKQEPDYAKENEWIPHQCGGCRWFGALDLDYGFCFCIESLNEGRIVFEHGGCIQHSDCEE